MAYHKSAEKRARQSLVRRTRNRAYISSVRSAVKTVKAGVEKAKSGTLNKDDLTKLLREAQSIIMKAGSKGLMHKNSTARRVKMLAGLVKTVVVK